MILEEDLASEEVIREEGDSAEDGNRKERKEIKEKK